MQYMVKNDHIDMETGVDQGETAMPMHDQGWPLDLHLYAAAARPLSDALQHPENKENNKKNPGSRPATLSADQHRVLQ